MALKHTDLAAFSEASADKNYYWAEAHRLMHAFLNKVPINTELAFNICELAEKQKSDHVLFKHRFFANEFPTARKTFNEALKKYEAIIEPLHEELNDLSKDIRRLSRVMKSADKISDETRDEFAEAKARKEEIKAQIAEHEYPDYSKRYNSESKKYREKPSLKQSAVTQEDWNWLLQHFEAQSKLLPPEAPHLIKNLRVISTELGLTDHEFEALKACVIYQKSPELRNLIEIVSNAHGNDAKIPFAMIAMMLGVDREALSKLYTADSVLYKYGFLTPSTVEKGIPTLSPFISKQLSDSDLNADQIKERLIGKPITPEPPDLDWDKDFAPMLGEDGIKTLRLVRAYKEKRESGAAVKKGLSVFFEGIPNTGKTSAAAALAKKLDLPMHVIGENAYGEKGVNEILSPQERFSQILMATALAGKTDRIFLVEEPDSFLPQAPRDGFPDSFRSNGTAVDPIDRVRIQRLFEENPALAMFFTTNGWGNIHPAVRRRVDQHVHFTMPSAQMRFEILSGLIQKAELTMDPKDIKKIADAYKITAGALSSAVGLAKTLQSKDPEENTKNLTYFIEMQARRDYGGVSNVYVAHNAPDHPYDFSLLNPVAFDVKPDDLVERLSAQANKDKAFTLCLEGYSGTGKSEYVWELARKLGKEVLVKTPADIFDMYSGETEKKINAAFEEAQRTGAILLFDEGDAYLQNRTEAVRSWEITQVNQILNNMERHKGVVAFTTNHFGLLDPASHRRFTFSIGFDFLTREQTYGAFEKFFGQKAPEGSLDKMKNLTPGDFAKAYKQADILGIGNDPEVLIDQLRNISKKKPKEDKSRSNPPSVGFDGHSGAGENGGHAAKVRIGRQ